MNRRIGLTLLTAILMIAMLATPISAAKSVAVHVDNGRPPYKYVSFYYIYGDRIEWWQGGARFILDTTTDEYKVIEEFMLALPSKLGIKVLAGEIHLVEGYLKAKYVFNGIIEFKNYMFIDENGVVVVEWQYGKGLNVTVYSKTTVNLTCSKVEGYGFAEWKQRVIGHARICDPILGCRTQPIYDSTPTAHIPAGSKILVVPAEGIVLEEDYRGYTHYLGGGPTLVEVGDKSRTVKAGQIFWDREPDYWFSYSSDGLKAVWKINNWFNKAVLIWPIPHEVKVVQAR